MRSTVIKRVALGGVVALTLAALAGDVSRAGKRGKRPRTKGQVVVPKWVTALTTKDTPVRGPRRPDLVVVEFSDYQCPFCSLAHTKMEKALKTYGKRIRFYYRHYPLDSSCNRQMKRQMHPFACLAAKVAICAKAQGLFWRVHDKLYKLQHRMSGATILAAAKSSGAHMGKLKRCLRSARTRRILQADIAAGNKARIAGTPTFYAGGTHIKRFELSSPDLSAFAKIFTALDQRRKKRRSKR